MLNWIRQFLPATDNTSARPAQVTSADAEKKGMEYVTLGNAHFAAGNIAAAADHYRQAVAVAPGLVDARFRLANMLQLQQKFDEAGACYRAVLEIDASHVESCCNLGIALQAQGHYAEAITYYRKALALQPHIANLHYYLGAALQAEQQLDAAVSSYDAAIALDPKHIDAHYHAGNVLRFQRKFEEAAEHYRRILALNDKLADVHCNLGIALQGMEQFDAAEHSYRQALSLQPGYPIALINLGTILQDRHALSAAEDCYRQVLAADSSSLEAQINLANVFAAQEKYAEALACCDAILKNHPDNADAHYSKALVLLKQGDYLAGWPEYEYRWSRSDAPLRPHFSEPQWTGSENISGKTILLYAEQGLGDTLQFIRFVDDVAKRGATVLLEVQPTLIPLLTSLGGVQQLLAQNASAARPFFDLQCSLLSLPHALKTEIASIPLHIPYLAAPSDRVQYWREHFKQNAAPRIGLAWAGNPQHKNDTSRSIPLGELTPLWEKSERHFFSLQKELRAVDAAFLPAISAITDLSTHLTDFAETAAIVTNLDLVITVDTSIAHLAGALGKPVWILLPHYPDFRWLVGRDDSPWYPTATLFRQASSGDWRNVIETVKAALDAQFKST